MTSRTTWLLATLVSLLVPLTVLAADPPRPPNVVFILADDLGYGDLGCYGATKIRTPHCDRLAEEGLRFTDAHSPSAVCTPTRYSVLTGRYCWRTWLKNWVLMPHHPLLIEPDRLTMGEMFQDHGYRAVCIGKWHLGWGREPGISFNGEVEPGPLEAGFDDFFGVPFSHNSPRPLRVFLRDRRIVGLEDGEDYRDAQVLQRTVRDLEDTAIELSKQAVASIEKNKDRPFFLFYPTTNIHFPITPNERFQGASDAGRYGDFVAEFDWAVGQVLQTLDRLDLTDDTIVVLTSDNGGRPMEGLNGHRLNGPWRGTKRTIYEGGHRIPLIVRWPGKVAPGTKTSETVCLLDFMRTFANMLGHELPAGAAEDSYDLSPVLFGQEYDEPLREATVHHSVNGTYAIRQGDWKLIEGAGDGDYQKVPGKGRHENLRDPGFPQRDPETGRYYPLEYAIRTPPEDGERPLQLYHLATDPTESHDVVADHPEKARALRRLLNRYRREGRSFPAP